MFFGLGNKTPEYKPKKVYCKYCGKKLVPDMTVERYNEQTGEKYYPYKSHMICPDASLCPSFFDDYQ